MSNCQLNKHSSQFDPARPESFAEIFRSKNIQVSGDCSRPLFLVASIADKVGDARIHKKLAKSRKHIIKQMYKMPSEDKPREMDFFSESGVYSYLRLVYHDPPQIRNQSVIEAFQDQFFDMLHEIRLQMGIHRESELKRIKDKTKLVNDSIARMEEKTAVVKNELKEINEKIKNAKENALYLTSGIYDDSRTDACVVEMSEFYIAQFLIIHFENGLTRELIPAEISDVILKLSKEFFRVDQSEFKSAAFRILDKFNQTRQK